MWRNEFVVGSHADWKATYFVPSVPSLDLAGKVLVAFGEIGSGLGTLGFGAKAAADLGIEYIYVAQRKKTQYQFLSRESFQGLFKHLELLGKKLYLYGASLGGYCALYYSRPTGGNFLALAPRIPAHPLISRLMTVRFGSEGFHHQELYEGGKRDCESGQRYVLYDSRNHVDNFYIETSVKHAYTDADYEHIEGAGHYVARALAGSGQLKGVLQSYVKDEPLHYSIDEAEIIAWHKERVKDFASQGKLNKAIEHLNTLIDRVESDCLFELAALCNKSFGTSDPGRV